jgi:hypothetical protein
MLRRQIGIALGAAFAASVLTLTVEHVVLHAPYAVAQESAPPLSQYVFFAQHRKDTEKDESFFFFNPETGDIYVYQEGEAKEHYRVRVVGEDFEKIN